MLYCLYDYEPLISFIINAAVMMPALRPAAATKFHVRRSCLGPDEMPIV